MKILQIAHFLAKTGDLLTFVSVSLVTKSEWLNEKKSNVKSNLD